MEAMVVGSPAAAIRRRAPRSQGRRRLVTPLTFDGMLRCWKFRAPGLGRGAELPLVSAAAARRMVWIRIRAWRRLGVAMRAIAAVLGGYVVAALASVVCATLLPMPRAEAVLTGMLLSFVVYAGAVVWVFAARTALRAWIGLLVPLAALAAAAWLSRP